MAHINPYTMLHYYPYTDFHELNLDWVLKEVKYLHDRVDSISARMDAAEENIEELRAEVASIKDEILALSASLSNLTDIVSSHTDAIAAINTSLASLQQNLSALSESITLLSQIVGEHTNDIANITDDIIDINNIIEDIRTEYVASVTGSGSAVVTRIANTVNVDVSYITTGKAAGTTVGMFATAEGTGTTSSQVASHAEGTGSQATGIGAHSEGGTTLANAMYAHSEGDRTIASAKSAHSEGEQTTASAVNAHAEGVSTTASGAASHAEGRLSQSTGSYSHAEGDACVADANYSHAEGSGTSVTAAAVAGHAEGLGSTVSGVNGAHAGGNYSQAIGNTSFAHGDHVITNNTNEVAFGQFNASDTTTGSRTVFSIGNGSDNNIRKNIFEIKENGKVLVNGSPISGGSSSFTITIEGDDYVDNVDISQYSDMTPAAIVQTRPEKCIVNVMYMGTFDYQDVYTLQNAFAQGEILNYTKQTEVMSAQGNQFAERLIEVRGSAYDDITARNLNPAMPIATSMSAGAIQVGNGLVINGLGVLSAAHTYSTTEQVVGTWIDGKPIYEKTFIGTAPSTLNTGEDVFYVGDLSIDSMCMYIKWVAKTTAGFNFTDDAVTSWLRRDSGSVAGNDYLTCNLKNATYQSEIFGCIIRFTKTTD